MKGKIKKIVLASLAVIIMTPSLVSANFIDMPNNWSTQSLEEAVHNGLLQGYKGKIYPDKALTRAEFAAVMTRALGLSTQANISKYKDVPKGEWYHDDMARAVYAGIFEGDHDRLHPERNVTREEAFTALGRSFILEGETNRLNRFKDGNQVANWAQYRINGLIDGAYISGDHLRRLNPRKQITRAEFSKIMDNIVKEYVTRPGVYNSLSERGNILVNRPGVTLKDMTLKGDLVIADGVADDEVTLSNMDMRGRLVLRGSSKLNIVDNSRIEEALVVNKLGESYIYVEKGSRVNLIVLKSKTQIVGDGRVDKIHVSKDADGSKIEVDGAEVTVEEGANDVTDKHGDQIKPGGTTDLDQGGEDSKADALARLIDLRREAGKMRNADLTAVVNQYSKVNNKSSIAEINRATNAIERKIEEVRRAIIARLKSYEKPIEAEVRQIPKQESPANLEREVNRVLRTYVKSPIKAKAQYVLVESKMEITLEESTVEHKFGIRLGAKDFVDPEKVSLYKKLGELIDVVKEDMKDPELIRFIQNGEYEKLHEKLYREQTVITESPSNIIEVRSKVLRLEKAIDDRRTTIERNLRSMARKLEEEAQEYDPVDNDQTLESELRKTFDEITKRTRSDASIPDNGMRRNNALKYLEVTMIESNIEYKFRIGLKNVTEVDEESLLKSELKDKIKELERHIERTGDTTIGENVLEQYRDYTKENRNVEPRLIEAALKNINAVLKDYEVSLKNLKDVEDSVKKLRYKQDYYKDIITRIETNYKYNFEPLTESFNSRIENLFGNDNGKEGLVKLQLDLAMETIELENEAPVEEINAIYQLLIQTEMSITRLGEDIKKLEEDIERIDSRLNTFEQSLQGKMKEKIEAKLKNSEEVSEVELREIAEVEINDLIATNRNYGNININIKEAKVSGGKYTITIESLTYKWNGKDIGLKDNQNIVI